MDITPWIIWFLEQIALAAQSSMTKLYKIRIAVLFWDRYRDVVFNPRQIKLIKRLLETEDFADGIARKKYKNLVKTTDITASRDLKNLCDKAVLIPVGAGRSLKYRLKI
ncbi:Fic family protein [Candidatus Venteria ishoeyi]|uniref:Uncharacterized protein n=2 Tax=Candidatus Venteria ishoeyi TaxID=1899563 RepID=A0A1H6FDG0_9GAMM|nr:hypothetical protein [Candidatus Venteria ishoeyi]SEH07359.1 Uncharacterised protein [Candidatus Venteria ishoeyi]